MNMRCLATLRTLDLVYEDQWEGQHHDANASMDLKMVDYEDETKNERKTKKIKKQKEKTEKRRSLPT